LERLRSDLETQAAKKRTDNLHWFGIHDEPCEKGVESVPVAYLTGGHPKRLYIVWVRNLAFFGS
jgi:hypothetical protein